MAISFELPADIENDLRKELGNLSDAAKEAIGFGRGKREGEDEEGQRLLLTLDDGSIWLVNADDSAKPVVASKCGKIASRSDPGSCMPSRIHLSAAGRYAVVNSKPQAFIAFDLDTGAERTLDLSRLFEDRGV